MRPTTPSGRRLIGLRAQLLVDRVAVRQRDDHLVVRPFGVPRRQRTDRQGARLLLCVTEDGHSRRRRRQLIL